MKPKDSESRKFRELKNTKTYRVKKKSLSQHMKVKENETLTSSVYCTVGDVADFPVHKTHLVGRFSINSVWPTSDICSFKEREV